MSQSICHKIQKSAFYYKRLMNQILAPYQLTFAQYQVLKTIQHHEGITAKDILIYIDSDKATLSGVLTRLEKNGLVLRHPDSNDRRLMHIYLTEKSRLFCKNIYEIEIMCESEMTGKIRSKDLKIFDSVYAQIIANLESKTVEKPQ